MSDLPQGRVRWRKGRKDYSWHAETHALTDGVTPWFVMVQQAGSEWFWYGLGANTAHNPSPTLAQAKAEALAHARAVWASQKTIPSQEVSP